VTTQEDLAELQLNLKIAFDHFRRAFKEELCGAALPGMNSAVARAEVLEKPQERTLDAKLADASTAAKRSFYSPHSALTATRTSIVSVCNHQPTARQSAISFVRSHVFAKVFSLAFARICA
jgi:hypothetical protein